MKREKKDGQRIELREHQYLKNLVKKEKLVCFFKVFQERLIWE